MSLRFLIDEDAQDRRLVKLLREASHDVVTANEVGLMSQPDPIVLAYAQEHNRLLLTFNCDDFEALHQENLNHSGILAVYQNANFAKDMSYKDIIRAIANLEVSGMPLANQFIPLNHWNY